ncbi:MAG: hypothetical protein HQL35_12230 [Alphaproteobacteria bacterium]|nr:hypothetical protein [Alphaproteobacteria bacterium]
MAKPAAKSLLADAERLTDEGPALGAIANPRASTVEQELTMLRGTFARSICNANGFASERERDACADGVPCDRVTECLAQAEKAIRHLRSD